MTLALDHPVATTVTTYLGRGLLSAELIADPCCPHTYAVRAVDAEEETWHFLLRHVDLSHVTEDDLEECEYETWPPKVGELRFIF